ncbi:uncharacterized protein LOC122390660 [Amphibalanus amphitrite]|uniref:uncharacterized protein LOC122390660 n=1 Tax=Amphibalanus amphitrite TaxID=1232801 RepID=UPI001C9299AA|nr:uncharacterized protein LOC122390660 [Amphibalanus amphitrite]XP_043239746.1 uncharacterized protein LOC122390660 [Amphibalanus amphitrite]XP_043239747.1 uncharacterized protein LOC122390660 [Amphibalanus amphitrite]XP_043239748.1 uncharacterized protein LOC122390660 [Amphibalanus amphitrite]XP_043239749.1 uncharacterized protein LOC122390660 [Amphibalanus amphitrite]
MVSSTYFKVAETRTAIVTLLLYYVLAAVWLGGPWIPTWLPARLAALLQTAHASYSIHGKQGLIAIPLIHCLECVVAHRRCRKLGIGGVTRVLWLLQTLAFGIGSLKFLLWPVEDSPVQQQKKKKKQ